MAIRSSTLRIVPSISAMRRICSSATMRARSSCVLALSAASSPRSVSFSLACRALSSSLRRITSSLSASARRRAAAYLAFSARLWPALSRPLSAAACPPSDVSGAAAAGTFTPCPPMPAALFSSMLCSSLSVSQVLPAHRLGAARAARSAQRGHLLRAAVAQPSGIVARLFLFHALTPLPCRRSGLDPPRGYRRTSPSGRPHSFIRIRRPSSSAFS